MIILFQLPRDDDGGGDADITDVTAMADVDINNEAKNLASSNEIGTEIRSAPGGDKAVSVNEQGNF